jgi:hypothetical protein
LECHWEQSLVRHYDLGLDPVLGQDLDPELDQETDPVLGQDSGLELDQEMDPKLDYFGLDSAVHNRIYHRRSLVRACNIIIKNASD